MKPVRFALRLQFAEAIRTRSLSYQIFTAISGEVPKQEPALITERGVQIRVEKDKATVLWLPTRCQIALEKLPDIPDVSGKKHYIDKTISVMETINEVAEIGKLSNRKLLTYWILPTPQYDFVSLQQKYSEMMITRNDISNTAYDASAILDIKKGQWILHHQSGAMEPQQLHEEYLNFKLDNVSKTFIFLEASLFDNNVLQYSKEELRSFMEGALEICISHMGEFDRICGGCL